MKKAISILICLLFILTALFPAGVLVSACIGYTFELVSVSAFAVFTALLSVCIVVLDFVFKNGLDNKAIQILSAVITPISLINAVFYIVECSKIWIVACVMICAGCCCSLTIKHGKPTALKRIALALSALMALPIGFFSFMALIFGNFGQDTVVQTVGSPSGRYYAEVLSSDQGALGGDTLVNVYEHSEINAVFFKIAKKPQCVYFGDWYEFENMQLHWKDDHCLVINSVEYEIEHDPA